MRIAENRCVNPPPRALHWLWAGAVATLAAGCLFTSLAADDTSSPFGFTGPEIFPIGPYISQLHVADLNGDGLNDLIVVNNARSKINILWNQTGKTNLTSRSQALNRWDINQLPPDARFRIDSIASEKRIFSLVTADLNGDGRPDIAYYGDPKELIVLYNRGTNGWDTKRWPIDDGQLSPNGLCTGDLNGDGRTDLVLLGDTCVYLLAQKADHTLGEPQRIPFSGSVRAIQVVDINGDGLKDLLLVNWEDPNPFRFRLQKPDHQLGPEIFFSSPPIRSYWADNLEENKKTQVITIAQNSGRAAVSEFVQKPADKLANGLSKGQFQVLPLRRTDRAQRGMVWADVNGDGLEDLLVAQPDSGQISIYLQEPDGYLASPKTYSTLAGVSSLAVGDWNGDGKEEIFMLSADENQVGVTRLDRKNGLPFPDLIPLPGKPLVMAVGKLDAHAKPVLAVIVDNNGKRSLVLRTADGKTKIQKLSDQFTSNPSSLAFHDADQDGHPDLVVLTPYDKVKVLRQVPGKDFEEIDVAPPGGVLERPWLSSIDIDGDGKPELLLPQKNFVRAVVLAKEPPQSGLGNDAGWTFRVKEQINGVGSDSRLAGAVAITSGDKGATSLFLLDVARKELTLCQRDHSGVWQVVRDIPLPISQFSGLQSISLGALSKKAVAFLGLNSVAYMPLFGKVWGLKELDGYETPIEGGRLTDVVSGDLDNDGRKDLVFLETARHYLDLVIFNSHHKLVPATRWPVFEERSFRAPDNALPEPREAAVADVTGDHKNDLIVLVHDRILVYPQQ